MKPEFRRSSACGDTACGCGCVEVKIETSTVVLKDTGDHKVVYSHKEWADFLKGAKLGEFDLPAS